MKKILLLVFLALILAGCKGGTEDTQAADKAFIGGTNGISIAFVDTEPPTEVLDDGQQVFRMTLLLSNLGEYTIPSGKILASLSGISREAFNLASLNVRSNFDLERAR